MTNESLARHRIVEAAIRECLAQWRGDKSFAWAGECGIFADYAFHEAQRHGVEPLLDSFDDGLTCADPVSAPPGISLVELEQLGVLQGLNHVWLVCDGRHFDAAHPEGVDNPAQLTSFKLGLVDMLQSVAPDKLKALRDAHGWWQEACQLDEDFQKVYAVRDASYEPN